MQRGSSPGRAAVSLQHDAASFPRLLPAQLAKGTGRGPGGIRPHQARSWM